jgi:hypothetical protein
MSLAHQSETILCSNATALRQTLSVFQVVSILDGEAQMLELTEGSVKSIVGFDCTL